MPKALHYETETVDAKVETVRVVRGKKGDPKKGEPGYVERTTISPAQPAYDYKLAIVDPIEGDSTGENTFVSVYDELTHGDHKLATKFLVKGFNYFAKKSAAPAKPKSELKQNKALQTLADALGISVAEAKAKLGIA